MNYIHNRLMGNMEGCKMIPITANPARFFMITFEGWKAENLSTEDFQLSEVIIMAEAVLLKLVDLYRKKYAFSEPVLHFQPANQFGDARIGLKIGVMDMERYNEKSDS